MSTLRLLLLAAVSAIYLIRQRRRLAALGHRSAVRPVTFGRRAGEAGEVPSEGRPAAALAPVSLRRVH